MDSGPKYRVSESILSKDPLFCRELPDGDLGCEVPEDNKCISFSIEELSTNKEINPEHFCGDFDESCVHHFSEEMNLGMYHSSIEGAC